MRPEIPITTIVIADHFMEVTPWIIEAFFIFESSCDVFLTLVLARGMQQRSVVQERQNQFIEFP